MDLTDTKPKVLIIYTEDTLPYTQILSEYMAHSFRPSIIDGSLLKDLKQRSKLIEPFSFLVFIASKKLFSSDSLAEIARMANKDNKFIAVTVRRIKFAPKWFNLIGSHDLTGRVNNLAQRKAKQLVANLSLLAARATATE